MAAKARDIFVNCPFDADYQVFFRAIVFVVVRSGFRPRCALETDDSSENRFEKICKIIQECRYGVHDISRTELDRGSGLPRFNMPLELGLYLGARRFGVRTQKLKRCIIFDKERYRFQQYISDISGQDIHSHRENVGALIQELAGWLRDQSQDQKVPGGRRIASEFAVFQGKLPEICASRALEPGELTFGDYASIVAEYLALVA
jgi:hypothetical protein